MKKRLLTFIITLTAVLSAFAQTTLTGRITDAWTGEPLIGATLVPKSSKELGAVTDADGNFTLTTKEIAAERFSSVHTVTTHRKNIFRKLNINTAHEAVKYALRAGLIDPSEFYI